MRTCRLRRSTRSAWRGLWGGCSSMGGLAKHGSSGGVRTGTSTPRLQGETGQVLAPLEDCLRRVLEAVRSGASIVVDEFQRVPERYWDLIALASSEAKGSLILCGSSLGVSRKVFDARSPLLGLFAPLHVKVASALDTVASLVGKLEARSALLWAVVARDPWLISHMEFSPNFNIFFSGFIHSWKPLFLHKPLRPNTICVSLLLVMSLQHSRRN
ncbi:MAG: hypothetical protein ACUVQY_10395 [Thermoproteota archaeon]